MTTPITLSAEWIAPGTVAAVTTSIEGSLAAQGGRVEGLDANFGSALKMRLIGSLFAGTEEDMPFHLHVDVRPGPTAEDAHVRSEMRSTAGWYAFRLSMVDAQYRHRFDEVTGALRAATGEVDA
ncbi:MAG: hypothetical protein WEA35_02835 [Candidatus Nanopelagicales bacterium]